MRQIRATVKGDKIPARYRREFEAIGEVVAVRYYAVPGGQEKKITVEISVNRTKKPTAS